MRSRPRGFTLIELLITISIVTILLAVAAPSFRPLIAKQRIKSVTSALSESAWLARSEALKRNTDVSFTFTSASAGWVVKLVNPPQTTLLNQEGFPTVTSTLKNGSTGVFTFNAYGRLASPQTIEFRSDSVAGTVKCITVSTSGKTSVKDSACT